MGLGAATGPCVEVGESLDSDGLYLSSILPSMAFALRMGDGVRSAQRRTDHLGQWVLRTEFPVEQNSHQSSNIALKERYLEPSHHHHPIPYHPTPHHRPPLPHPPNPPQDNKQPLPPRTTFPPPIMPPNLHLLPSLMPTKASLYDGGFTFP